MSGENFNYGTPSKEPQSKGMAVASMVLGIVSIVTSCIWYLSIPCGIVGLILGIVFNKNNEPNGMSKAGIICSVIGMVVCIALIVLVVVAGVALVGMGY